jgi:hypothetical protein
MVEIFTSKSQVVERVEITMDSQGRESPKQLFKGQQLKQRPPLPTEDSDTHPTPEKGDLYCKGCQTKITNENQIIVMGGKNQQTFFNPTGMVFQISCFKEAPGCQTVGLPSSDFSWFSGYKWQIAHCHHCLTHLGWFFTHPQNPPFFGLILARLTGGK